MPKLSNTRNDSTKTRATPTTQRNHKQAMRHATCGALKHVSRKTHGVKHCPCQQEISGTTAHAPPQKKKKLLFTLLSFWACFNVTDQRLEKTRTLKQSVASSAPQPEAMCYMAIHATNKREQEHRKVKSRRTTDWSWAPDHELQ